MAAVEWMNPGLATSVQGRPFRGHRHHGMPLSGAGDGVALALANWLAGNPAETAAIETAYAPLSFRIAGTAQMGVQGAAAHILINDDARDSDKTISLNDGDVVTIPAAPAGCRSYIAFAGGIPVQPVLGATSTYLPAHIGGSAALNIAAGEKMPIGSGAMAAPRQLPAAYRMRYSGHFILRFVAGPEYDWLANAGVDAIDSREWSVGLRSNRMGLQLEGAALSLARQQQLDSSAVFPGTIQCPPSGLPFLLGPDAQTTGGYPRIAQIIRADRHIIGQMRAGAKVRLQRIGPEEAQRLYRSKLDLLRKLQPDIRLD